MNYDQASKEQLLERIMELELLNRQLLNEKEQEVLLDYAWTGNLGHWYWNVKTNTVTFNPLKVTTLGYSLDEIPEPATYQFFTEKLHPEDYEAAMGAMVEHLYGRSPVYEVEYRIQAKDGTYRWYYDRGKITQVDNEGNPLFLAGIVFDITEKKALLQELEQHNKHLAEMSEIDGLTLLHNHRALIEHLKAQIADARRLGAPLAIAMFDIDNFKGVNDCYGHVFGDRVLIEVASRITENIRETDVAGRYGGEEFMVIYPGTGLANAARISERIRRAVADKAFESNLRVTISGGVAVYTAQELLELIDSADKRLYEAKRLGKNRIST